MDSSNGPIDWRAIIGDTRPPRWLVALQPAGVALLGALALLCLGAAFGLYLVLETLDKAATARAGRLRAARGRKMKGRWEDACLKVERSPPVVGYHKTHVLESREILVERQASVAFFPHGTGADNVADVHHPAGQAGGGDRPDDHAVEEGAGR